MLIDRKNGLSLSASTNDVSQMLNKSAGLQSSLLCNFILTI